jgi:hypothetical protein
MAEDRAERPAPWNDRAFGAIPLAPAWIAAGLALALLCLFLVTVIATGDLAEFMEREGRWWQDRDGRLAVLIVLFTAYLPAARRYEELGVRRNLREIHSSVDWAPGQLEAVAGGLRDVDPHGRRVACALALVAIPVTALLVDRDPSLYFRSGYWDATHFWTYGLAAVLCWNVGALVHAISLHARAFSRVARSIPEVDLLNLSVFGPFVRQGMLSALPGVVVLSFLALNLADRGFLWAIGVLGSVRSAATPGHSTARRSRPGRGSSASGTCSPIAPSSSRCPNGRSTRRRAHASCCTWRSRSGRGWGERSWNAFWMRLSPRTGGLAWAASTDRSLQRESPKTASNRGIQGRLRTFQSPCNRSRLGKIDRQLEFTIDGHEVPDQRRARVVSLDRLQPTDQCVYVGSTRDNVTSRSFEFARAPDNHPFSNGNSLVRSETGISHGDCDYQ